MGLISDELYAVLLLLLLLLLLLPKNIVFPIHYNDDVFELEFKE